MLTNREILPERPVEEAQRQLRLVAGDGPPTTTRLALDAWLDREMHTRFVVMRDALGHVPSEGIFDIRRHHRRPWRTLAKRLYEAVAAGETQPTAAEDVSRLIAQYTHAARRIAERERVGCRARGSAA